MLKALKNKLFTKSTKWRNKRSLLGVAQAEGKINFSIKKIIGKKIELPSWLSIWESIAIVVVFIFLFFLIKTQILFQSMDTNYYQNLFPVYSIILTIISSLVFFNIREFSKERDKEGSYKGSIILRRSSSFSLLLAGILFSFLFWGPENIFGILPVIFIGLFTLYSLYKTFRLMNNDFYLKKEESEMFFEHLRDSFLKASALENAKLVSNDLLHNLLKDYEDFVEITPFSSIDEKNYTSIKTSKSGVFVNLYLKPLNKLQFKFLVENSIEGQRIKDPYCYISPRLFCDTKEVNDVLLWVRNDLLINMELKNKIKKLAHQAFLIEQPKFNLEHIRNNVNKLKLICLDLIKEQKSNELNEALNNYVKLIEDLYLKPNSKSLLEKQVHKTPIEMLLGGFDPLIWIGEDIQEIFERGVKSDNKKIIADAGYLPLNLMVYAIDYKNHFIFQKFRYYPLRLYQAYIDVKKSGRDELATFLFDRSWRYLKEISDYHLEPKLKKDKDYPKDKACNFACAILKIFQDLLKISFDEKDFESFEKYLSVTNKLYRDLDIAGRYEDNDGEQIADFLKNKKSEMLFGLTSWIFDKFSQAKESEKIKQFYDIIQKEIPQNIEKLTNIFSHVHNYEAENFWEWDHWELSEKEEGEVHIIQILGKLEKFYIVKLLSLLSEKSDGEIEKMELLYSRDLANLAKDDGELMIALDEIQATPGNWQFILNDKTINKIGALRTLLAKTKNTQEQEEVELKREKMISQEEVQKFKSEVLEAFSEKVKMRDIFKKYFTTYEDKTKEKSGEKGRLGVNTVTDKAAFFDEWHVRYHGWGENYGRRLASGEDFHLLKDIVKDCVEITNTRENFQKTLVKFENPKDAVILIINIVPWEFFEGLKNFKPKWDGTTEQLEINGFDGSYDLNGELIPVFQIYDRNFDEQILILNKSKIGKFIQLSPLNEGDKEDLIKDIFYMDIQAFSENAALMEELIAKMPEWLKEIGDEQKQREYLQERVHIQIFEKFKYEKAEDFEGYKLLP